MSIRSTDPRFSPPSPAIEKRIEAIIARLSLEEKIDLLGGHEHQGSTKGNVRAGIPEIKMADGPVGVHWFCKTSTAYPASITNAATWDPELIHRLGQALGRDGRARGVHILLAPGVNHYRSPLCGRNFEYLGEDPYLASQIVAAYVKGVQSQGVSTTVKHYAVNYQEYDRHNVSSDVDERTLHEIYLPAFKAAIEAGSGCIMTAYNLVNAVHCSEHDYLNNKVLKGEWGFDGVVMSDWVSTYSEVGAANGGLDLEMPTAKWLNREKLLPAVKAGKVKESVIDDKIRRILRLAICFGWLDNRQEDPSIPMDDRVTGQVALDVARSGIVVLKNEGGILPLDRSAMRRVAVVGPNAHPAVIGGGGSAYTQPTHAVSVLEGVKAFVTERVEVVHAVGPVVSRDRRAFERSEFRTERNEPGVTAEYFNNDTLSGEPAVTRVEERPNHWWGSRQLEGITVQHFSARWKGVITPPRDGTYVFYASGGDGGYRVRLDGHLMFDTWDAEKSGTLEAEMHLTGGAPLVLAIEYRKTRHWAHMHFGWENKDDIAKEIDEALAAVAGADAAIVCAGFDQHTEGEGWDRTFAMQRDVDRFVAEVARRNANTVVVLTGGGNMDMSGWVDAVKGVVHAWYPGQEGGTAVAEVLFGGVNPSGRLPITLEARLEDRSSHGCYHDSDNDKHVRLTDGVFTGYRHHDKTGVAPRFPFGFGLSYTTFAYSGLKLSAERLKAGDTLRVSFEVKNTGTRAGADVAQVYVSDTKSTLPRPPKELKGFAKVFLQPGEKKRVTVDLAQAAFACYDPQKHGWVVEPGEFGILVGRSSADILLRAAVTVGAGAGAPAKKGPAKARRAGGKSGRKAGRKGRKQR